MSTMIEFAWQGLFTIGVLGGCFSMMLLMLFFGDDE
jgi:hypothetical protein